VLQTEYAGHVPVDSRSAFNPRDDVVEVVIVVLVWPHWLHLDPGLGDQANIPANPFVRSPYSCRT